MVKISESTSRTAKDGRKDGRVREREMSKQ